MTTIMHQLSSERERISNQHGGSDLQIHNTERVQRRSARFNRNCVKTITLNLLLQNRNTRSVSERHGATFGTCPTHANSENLARKYGSSDVSFQSYGPFVRKKKHGTSAAVVLQRRVETGRSEHTCCLGRKMVQLAHQLDYFLCSQFESIVHDIVVRSVSKLQHRGGCEFIPNTPGMFKCAQPSLTKRTVRSVEA